MLQALFLAGAMLDDTKLAAVELKTRIVAASIFKPGVALIVREVDVPAGKNKYKLDVLPDVLDGSFWYSSTDGVQIGDVQTKLRYEDKKITTEAESIADYLFANKGKHVSMTILATRGTQTSEEPLSGTIVSSGGTSGVTLKLANGNLRQVAYGSILELNTQGLSNKVERTVPSAQQQIDFDIDARKSGHVRFVTLENGAAWSGSYLVELKDATKAEISAKAQVVVGSLTFDGTDVQVLAGMPALPKTPKFDLVAGFGSMIAYLKGTQETYRAYRQGPKDPYSMLAQVLNDAQNRLRIINYDVYANSYPYGGAGGGGFGGGQGAYFAEYGGRNLDVDAMNMARSNEQQRNEQGDSDRVEDLFSYPLGKLSLEPGDRMTRMFIEQAANYERLYRWEIYNQRQQYQQPVEKSRVVKILRLQNRGKQPWTGGTALVLKDGSPLAQSEMPFTAAGQDANVELGEVQDIPVSKESKELKRESVTMFNRHLTAITVETKLTVENSRSESLKIEVRYDVSGDVLTAEGAEQTALGSALDAVNKNMRLTWTLMLKPGEKAVLTALTKTLV